MNSYIVKEKLPKEVAARQRLVETLQRVAAQPAMGQQEIDQVNKQVGYFSLPLCSGVSFQ